MEIATLQLDKICRVCMNEGNMKSINAESTVDSKLVCLSEIITFCVSLEVAENDGLPSQICTQCMEELCRYYKFKLQCQKSDETLRYYINLTESEIKNEDTLTDELENVVIKHEAEVTSDDSAIKKSKKKLQLKESTINIVESEFYDETGEDSWSDVSWSLDNSSDREKPIKKPNSGPPFLCNRCDICFETSEELIEHRLTVKHPRKRTHLCTICSKAFTYSQLKVHMRSHTREKPFSCEVCSQRFSLNCNLRRHMMRHTGERPHKCDICSKGFIQSTSLQEHVRTHTGETPFVCSYCGKSFTQSGQLRTHVKKHNSSNGDINLTKHQCNICEKLFQSKSILKTHLLIHGEKSFLCSDCGRGFVSLAGLHSHSKTHTGVKPYPCSVCGKSFSQVGSLKSHSLIHTGEKPFACSVCNRAFTQRNHLRYHMRTHSGERPYKCSVCDKSFSLNGTLTVHMRTHTGETPYACDVCGKGFYDSSSMKKHRRSHNQTIIT